MRFREFLAAAAVLGIAMAIAVETTAQPFPSRPIRIVVALPPGGPMDAVARIAAERMSSAVGQAVIVENRPGGAGGTVGTKSVAGATPDGYTLLLAGPSLATGSSIYPNLGYDPVKSFEPIAIIAQAHPILVINAAVPANSLRELAAYAKANPGKVRFGSAGYGTLPHLIGEWFKWQAAIDIVHIPYRGAAPAVSDLVAGQVQMFIESGPGVLPHIEAGKLRALAVTGEKRNSKLPDVPTTIESGFPAIVASYSAGLVAPAGTPPNVISRLNAAINDGLNSSEMHAGLARIGLEPVTGSPQDYAMFIARETRKWAAVVKAAGIKVD